MKNNKSSHMNVNSLKYTYSSSKNNKSSYISTPYTNRPNYTYSSSKNNKSSYISTPYTNRPNYTYSSSNYLSRLLTPEYQREVIKSFKRLTRSIKYNALVGTGISGTLMCGLLSSCINKPIIIVRKSGDKRHSTHNIDGVLWDGIKLLFVDDFVSSGKTFKRCKKALLNTKSIDIVGMFLGTTGWDHKNQRSLYRNNKGYIIMKEIDENNIIKKFTGSNIPHYLESLLINKN